MDESLRNAARGGNVNDLYTLMHRNGNVLKRIDEVEFIDTPLHIAADAGHIDLAMEIMILKPSFARKLNTQGLSPIHLAVEKKHKELVLNILKTDKDIVRVKGKNAENQTALHIAVRNNKEEALKILCKMLRKTDYCQDVLNQKDRKGKTALQIARDDNKSKMAREISKCNCRRKNRKRSSNERNCSCWCFTKELFSCCWQAYTCGLCG
ncbi:hypothetical protein PTKIN_Ptkin16aG0497700 [Pterospermum kingtungense]